MRVAPALGLLVPSFAHGATLQVGSGRPYLSIQDAIDDAVDGDQIEIYEGTYREALYIDVDIALLGVEGPDKTLILPRDGTAIRVEQAEVRLIGLEISVEDAGQGLHANQSQLHLTDVWFTDITNDGSADNGSPEGAGARFFQSTAELVDVRFDGNTSTSNGGGVAAVDSDLTLSGVDFVDNRATTAGGGLLLRAGSTVVGEAITFQRNRVSASGGGIAASEGSAIDLTDSRIEGNATEGTSAGPGGGLHLSGGSRAALVRAVVATNSARGGGGGIYVNGATLDTESCDFQANLTTADHGLAVHLAGTAAYTSLGDTFSLQTTSGARLGGGVYTTGSARLHVDGSAFLDNSAQRGGAIAHTASGPLTAIDARFDGNRAQARGAAIDFAPSALTAALNVSGSTFADNQVVNAANGNLGGGIYATIGAIAVSDSRFTGNRAPQGGGIFATAVSGASILRSTFCANTATNGVGGGATLQTLVVKPDIRASIFAENSATTQGGGLHLANVATVGASTVRNNDFLGNRATLQGGGVYYNNATIDFVNNLVWQNTAGSGVSANNGSLASPSIRYDLWTDNVPGALGEALASTKLDATHLIGADPTLVRWSANGDCDDDDLRPRLGSPLIDAGDPNWTDPDASRSDIGAYGGDANVLSWYADLDNDSFIALYDCDDARSDVFPGGVERCNLRDDDCDGLTDESDAVDQVQVFPDGDGDGYGDADGGTLACPIDGQVSNDDDCDDAIASVHPGASESCNLRDDDCDGLIDDAPLIDAVAWYVDADADGYGDASDAVIACAPPPGRSRSPLDCDDASGDAHPGAPEVCNGVDDDCDGRVDIGVASGIAVFPDVDGDGHGDPSRPTYACALHPGYASIGDDCDDDDALVSPDAEESCNLQDDDCDGAVDEDVLAPPLWYLDADADGFGTSDGAVASCAPITGRSARPGDCDDDDARYHPGAAETCAGAEDLNCDGSVGNADQDGDGAVACEDCDDRDATISPTADERCNGVDDDCDGAWDEDDAVDAPDWYPDTDGDGFGAEGDATTACEAPPRAVSDGRDCDDDAPDVHPYAPEACDSAVDRNCDGETGEQDHDGDGLPSCLECDDGDPTVFPGAVESCDGADNDCDAEIDEQPSTAGGAWYADADGDGHGDAEAVVWSCDGPDGFVASGDDCDDLDANAYPGAPEQWYDGADQACDGGDDLDQDGDGRPSAEHGGTDCDDLDPSVYPGAEDPVGDSLDADCTGEDGPPVDDTDVPVARGRCGCAPTGAAPSVPLALAWAIAGLLRRRRPTPEPA